MLARPARRRSSGGCPSASTTTRGRAPVGVERRRLVRLPRQGPARGPRPPGRRRVLHRLLRRGSLAPCRQTVRESLPAAVDRVLADQGVGSVADATYDKGPDPIRRRRSAWSGYARSTGRTGRPSSSRSLRTRWCGRPPSLAEPTNTVRSSGLTSPDLHQIEQEASSADGGPPTDFLASAAKNRSTPKVPSGQVGQLLDPPARPMLGEQREVEIVAHAEVPVLVPMQAAARVHSSGVSAPCPRQDEVGRDDLVAAGCRDDMVEGALSSSTTNPRRSTRAIVDASSTCDEARHLPGKRPDGSSAGRHGEQDHADPARRSATQRHIQTPPSARTATSWTTVGRHLSRCQRSALRRPGTVVGPGRPRTSPPGDCNSSIRQVRASPATTSNNCFHSCAAIEGTFPRTTRQPVTWSSPTPVASYVSIRPSRYWHQGILHR